MLLGNYSVLAKHPGRDIGGGAIGAGNNRSDFNKSSQARGAFNLETWEPKSGIPDGYRPPYSWVIPQTAGGLSARNNVGGFGNLTLNLAGGVNGTATLAGTGTLSGTAQLVISLVASLSGSGTISSAVMQAFLQLAAALSGSGTTAGTVKAIGHLATALSGVGTVAGTSAATALGTLAADITVTGGTLNTANVASAVWNALAASFNTAGTMGAQLNSGGDPWGEVLEGTYTAGEIMQVIASVLAGTTSIVDLGGGQATAEFTAIDGSVVRVLAEMTGSERTEVTINPINPDNTWNPADKNAAFTLSGGNLIASITDSMGGVRGTHSRDASGDYYFEVTIALTDLQHLAGIGKSTASLGFFPGYDADGWGMFFTNGTKYTNLVSTAYYGAAWPSSTVGVRVHSGQVSFYYATDTTPGVAYSGISGSVFPMYGPGADTGTRQGTLNVGASAWAFGLPSGSSPWG